MYDNVFNPEQKCCRCGKRHGIRRMGDESIPYYICGRCNRKYARLDASISHNWRRLGINQTKGRSR